MLIENKYEHLNFKLYSTWFNKYLFAVNNKYLVLKVQFIFLQSPTHIFSKQIFSNIVDNVCRSSSKSLSAIINANRIEQCNITSLDVRKTNRAECVYTCLN